MIFIKTCYDKTFKNCHLDELLFAEKFLAFKTPLGPRYDDEIPEANRFQLPMLFAYLQLGLIIDLTNTNRFYDKTVVERTGIKHIKMQLKGHGETPSKEQVALFIRMCDRYFDQNPGELIEKDDWSIEAAIHCFAQCRPPGIYKAHYLQDLVKRYGDSNESIAAPELPDWCYDEEEGLSDNEEENGRTVEDGMGDSQEVNQCPWMSRILNYFTKNLTESVGKQMA
ncbi:hypothetical protein pdam_00011766 [Pocillopora damicornis]|uniref:Uncharacterized protein n=1 Tax=Pocillopora damicornis TaxID=46731 RepID=A0A3M6U2L3_POCDA|nr:hypothetical protein pdam_00011766 [Pocillopora damicornis]